MVWHWMAFQAFGTFIGACVLLGAYCLARRQILEMKQQLREMKRSTQTQLVLPLFKELRSSDARSELRDYVYKLDRDKPVVNKKNSGAIEEVVNRINMLGILVWEGIVDESLAMKSTRSSAIRAWYKLENYIRLERDKRGQYAIWFEDYVSRCLRYEQENLSEADQAKLEGKNLVEELKKERGIKRPQEYHTHFK